jgi:hypothetical protein
VGAVDGLLVTGPHGQRDAQRLVEPLEPLGGRRQGQAQGGGLVLLVPGPDAEPGAAAGEHVECGHRLDQQRRLAEGDRADHGAQAYPLAGGGEVTEGGARLEHRPIGGSVGVGLDEVVGDPQGVRPGLVGRLGDGTEVGAVVIRHADADAHVLTAFGS